MVDRWEMATQALMVYAGLFLLVALPVIFWPRRKPKK